MRLSCFGQIMSVAGLAVLFLLPIAGTRAQRITVDGRLSPAQTLIGPNYAIGANLGKQVGSNLFHSFGAFGLNRNETATFSGPASGAAVANVIGRVTGGAQSSIDGTVRSAMPGANVYLINPAGVVFGPNAQVNVSGSFHASSADYLRLQDGARFQATNPDASTLTAAPPAAFGFLSPNPGPVTVSGATLGAAKGGTLGLVGGPVTISGGVLQAPAGAVHITSAAGPGEVAVNPRSAPASTVSSFGPVRVGGKSKIAVSDAAGLGSGGSVFIRAGALDVAAASEIDADNHGAGPGGVVSLRSDGAVTISDGANVHADTYGTGRGGTVTVRADSIVQDASYISANTQGTGQGGEIGVTATGNLTILNGGNISSITSGAGSGGQVTASAGSLAISLGGQITAGTYSSGDAGSVSVRVPGTMVIDGSGATGLTGIGSQAQPGSTGNAGSMAVSAGNLTIRNGGAISSNTFGPGGSVTVQADSIMLQDAGYISANTQGTGQGG
ncbi:MAG: filamentous hemagglutinin N-terminal domain-containing protein, partial [Rhodopila sp.]